MSLYFNKSKCIHKQIHKCLTQFQFMRPWDYTWRDLDSICHKQIIHCFIHAHTLRQRTELFTPALAYACIYSRIRMSVFPNNILNVHAYAYEAKTHKYFLKTFCSGKTTLKFILFRHLLFSRRAGFNGAETRQEFFWKFLQMLGSHNYDVH